MHDATAKKIRIVPGYCCKAVSVLNLVARKLKNTHAVSGYYTKFSSARVEVPYLLNLVVAKFSTAIDAFNGHLHIALAAAAGSAESCELDGRQTDPRNQGIMLT